MTNFEKYKDDMDTTNFAVVDGKPVSCNPDTPCYKCEFSSIDSDDNFSCYGIKIGGMRMEWLKAECKESKISIPDDTPIDTKVLVSTNGIDWYKRHYAGLKDGKHSAWRDGKTSFTIDANNSKQKKSKKRTWEYMKLYNEDEE